MPFPASLLHDCFRGYSNIKWWCNKEWILPRGWRGELARGGSVTNRATTSSFCTTPSASCDNFSIHLFLIVSWLDIQSSSLVCFFSILSFLLGKGLSSQWQGPCSRGQGSYSRGQGSFFQSARVILPKGKGVSSKEQESFFQRARVFLPKSEGKQGRGKWLCHTFNNSPHPTFQHKIATDRHVFRKCGEFATLYRN